MFRDCLEAGWRIFALWPINDDGSCGCGNPDCQQAGKHPFASNWQHTPDWSGDQIDIMDDLGRFSTGYGILLKRQLVIDVDERNGGAASYAKLLEEIPEIAGCGFIVQTGSGGASKHLYFNLDEDLPLVQHLDDFPGIDFKSTGFVVGPQSRHKSGGIYQPIVGSPHDAETAPRSLLERLRKPNRHRANINGTAVDVSTQEVEQILSAIPNTDDTDYETWIRVGMALHQTLQGSSEGYALWLDWSAKSGKHDPRLMDRKWHSFGKSANPVTLATLVHYAEEAGWQAPVEFISDAEFLDDAQETILDTNSVDLLRPPGFVGDLVQWINERNRHPREHLAVAAALAVVSSVAGMRYTDPLDGVTPNLFLFGVSGSATGKESILRSCQELMRSAGISPAVHGGIKSEQEIFRNLIRHQAAIYVLDELGEVLAKLQNARTKGTTPYLEGAIGQFMAIYSKASSFTLVTGDLKEEIRASLQREAAAVNKMMDEQGEKDSLVARLDSIKRQLDTIDNGIERPFLNIFGLTTPERFDTLMDFDMAASGFLGRSVIFRELDDNPRAKPRGKILRGAVPDKYANTLRNLYAPGHSEQPLRVERIGDLVEIPTRPDAQALLDQVEEEFWELAEQTKDSTGLTAIPRRGYEMVAKVSTVLAIPAGVRTAQDVLWSYALVRRDIDSKIMLAHANSAADKGDALASAIMGAITKDHGETLGRINSKCRKYKKDDIKKTLDALEKAGHVRSESVAAGRGKQTKKYFAVKG